MAKKYNSVDKMIEREFDAETDCVTIYNGFWLITNKEGNVKAQCRIRSSLLEAMRRMAQAYRKEVSSEDGIL